MIYFSSQYLFMFLIIIHHTTCQSNENCINDRDNDFEESLDQEECDGTGDGHMKYSEEIGYVFLNNSQGQELLKHV